MEALYDFTVEFGIVRLIKMFMRKINGRVCSV
jgi:hypothetical protein